MNGFENYFDNQQNNLTYIFQYNNTERIITSNESLSDLTAHLYLTGCSFIEIRDNIPVFSKSSLFPYYPVYMYFSQLGIDFNNKTVLDFGGNHGNLIRSSNNIIQEKNYTCVDISKQGLAEGKLMFPNASWIYYNRYHPVYNKDGNKEETPTIKTYDIIIANSVFNHFTDNEIKFFVNYLYKHLNPNGKFYFTWCNVDNEHCYETFRKIRSPIFEEFEKPMTDSYTYICNNKQSNFILEETEFLLTFHKKDYLMNLFRNYNPKHYDAVGTWPLDCIEIGKT